MFAYLVIANYQILHLISFFHLALKLYISFKKYIDKDYDLFDADKLFCQRQYNSKMIPSQNYNKQHKSQYKSFLDIPKRYYITLTIITAPNLRIATVLYAITKSHNYKTCPHTIYNIPRYPKRHKTTLTITAASNHRMSTFGKLNKHKDKNSSRVSLCTKTSGPLTPPCVHGEQSRSPITGHDPIIKSESYSRHASAQL